MGTVRTYSFIKCIMPRHFLLFETYFYAYSDNNDLFVLYYGLMLQKDRFCKIHTFFLITAVEATLKFTYVAKYPDEPPLWEIYSQENLEDGDMEDILTLLNQQ
ncbi:hypothetical protein GOODEAATRI_032701, partial [Goodea atripinnis]